MATELSRNAGNSGSEERFIELFCELYGIEKGQYVYLQYPFLDIYGRHRSIDFAMQTEDGMLAVEVDGNTWHQPGKVSEDKYHDDLLKQNSLVHEGWRVYRWTSRQLDTVPERIKDEMLVFFGSSPELRYIDDFLPSQKGQSISLMEHQNEALQCLADMRSNEESIALLYHATGAGKTVTAISDAKTVGKRTLMLAHTKELVFQAYEQFKRLWPEVSIGRYVEGYREKDEFVVCGSIQSITANLDDFKRNEFGYIIIDECHHGTSDTYRRVLSHFKPEFTLGLTATPERTDGENLLEIFQKVAHKLDLQKAVEIGTLTPVRCIRIKTNIDMRDVRINGFRYNTLDLNTTLLVPERNNLIVDTWMNYVRGKKTVVFCTSVQHAKTIAELFRGQGIEAHSISGSMNTSERKHVLRAYENGSIPILCACDLLNEGWDSPQTQVLFMARPTMSKTLYMQQLGRGMRKCEGKDCLYVFDFVDNANMFNTPYTIHRLLNISQYRPGSLVLGKKSSIQWEQDMFAKGVKPEVLIDYPFSVSDYEVIDLFNWQERTKDLVSQIELTRRVNVQSETIEKYIREGKLVPDMVVPIGENHSLKYFMPERVETYSKQYGWTMISSNNMKEMFMQMVQTMTVSYSYKPVFLKAFFDYIDENGTARIEDIVQYFASFYEDRINKGLPAEKKPCIFTKGNYSDKDIERLVLSMPFKRFEDMGFFRHAKQLGLLQIDRAILKRLSSVDISAIVTRCDERLKEYFTE